MLTRTRSRSAAALIAGCIPGFMAAQTPDLSAITDKVFAPWNSTHTPGCAVGIARGGQVLLRRGYGMADIVADRSITAETILESGSVAKQFTATAVLLLMADGKVSLDDDARKYLPELPVYSRPITIRHLLTHTSGLREWSNLVEWQGWPRGTRAHTQSDVFELVTHQTALNYAVGDYYSYTNSGFLLLRTLVERVSGQSFTAFTDSRIFRPLGMTHTRWRDDFTRIVPGLAQAYRRSGDGWHLDMPFDNVIGAGGLLTTVGDWLAWNEALTRKTLGAAVVDSMMRRMRLTSGLEIQYALGIVQTRYRGLREVSHSGSTAGYSTFLARYPERDNLSIAVMCNAAGAGATAYTHAIVDALLPDLPRAAAMDTVSSPTEQADLANFAGFYRDTRTNTPLELELINGQLRRAGSPAGRSLRDGTVAFGATRVRLERGADGKPRSLKQATADGDTVVYVFAGAPWTPLPVELTALAGRYRNDEIGVTFEVKAGNGILVMSPRAGVTDTLTPTYRDAFRVGGGSVWFTRDGSGRVVAKHLGSSRVWDFVSQRVR